MLKQELSREANSSLITPVRPFWRLFSLRWTVPWEIDFFAFPFMNIHFILMYACIFRCVRVSLVVRRGCWIPCKWSDRQRWTTHCECWTEPRSSARAASALNLQAVSPAPTRYFQRPNQLPTGHRGLCFTVFAFSLFPVWKPLARSLIPGYLGFWGRRIQAKGWRRLQNGSTSNLGSLRPCLKIKMMGLELSGREGAGYIWGHRFNPSTKKNQIKFSSLSVSTVLFLLTVNKNYFLGGLVINLLNLVLLKTLSDMLISFLHK